MKFFIRVDRIIEGGKKNFIPYKLRFIFVLQLFRARICVLFWLCCLPFNNAGLLLVWFLP